MKNSFHCKKEKKKNMVNTWKQFYLLKRKKISISYSSKYIKKKKEKKKKKKQLH